MTELVQRVDAAAKQLEDQQKVLTSAAAAMADATTSLDLAALDQSAAGVDDLTGAGSDLEGLGGAIAGQFDGLLTSLSNDSLTAADSARGELFVAWDTVDVSLDAFAEQLSLVPDAVQGFQSKLLAQVEQNSAQLGSATDELEQQLGGFASALSEVIVQQIDAAVEAVKNEVNLQQSDLGAKLQPRIEAIGQELLSAVETSFTDFLGTGDDASKMLMERVENALNAFQEELAHVIEDRLPEAQKELVDHAAEALSKEIVAGIAMSTVGTQVTVALGPYMPTLLVVRASLNAILDVIRMWNQIKTGGGVFG